MLFINETNGINKMRGVNGMSGINGINGIIVIDKPAGITSQGVVAKLRGMLGQKKAGHTGTLDPMATGVLAVCCGNATRAAGMITSSEKRYHANVKIGISTDTLDTEGQITDTASESSVDSLTSDMIISAVKAFKGRQKQIPPMYSALKVKGKRLYSYAREGVEIERAPRDIEIYDISASDIDIKKRSFELDVHCSSGTYIRSLIDDIGKALGVPCVMSGLRRIYSGGFDIKDAVTLEEIQEIADKALIAAEADCRERRDSQKSRPSAEFCSSGADFREMAEGQEDRSNAEPRSSGADCRKMPDSHEGRPHAKLCSSERDRSFFRETPDKDRGLRQCNSKNSGKRRNSIPGYTDMLGKMLKEAGILMPVDSLFLNSPAYRASEEQDRILMNGGTIVPCPGEIQGTDEQNRKFHIYRNPNGETSGEHDPSAGGKKIQDRYVNEKHLVRMYSSDGVFQALYEYDGRKLIPYKMFLQ